MSKSPLSIFKDKSILITGGTGSFGRALTKKLLRESDCRKVIILSRDEWKQWEMKNSDPLFDHPNIRYFLGDVRDKERLDRAFNEVNFVVHAAALKQVPAAEYNPTEFIKTNVIGAMNVIDAAIYCNVEKVVALSTDKAVNPINLYGASKLCSDRLFIAGNSYVGDKGIPRLSVVRYGNVLGSRGSVIPYWKGLMDSGATSLPITDERMTRFWITLEQSVDFVINAFNEMRGGEIFIPKIPSMRTEDLAKAIAPHLTHTFSGIREGEKLHELMIGIDDARHTFEYDNYYMIVPDMYVHKQPFFKNYMEGRQGKQLTDGFSYGSNTNTEWLGVEDLRRLIPTVAHID
ncbi:MAG TPA: UDP-N-acetylglucosamine 4,6-dehydratase (inverting) [Parachlamydiaceae bacterium]|nr:UDP-N-acetylglucosamine 4,6-dehydratase (inverting) [Parachlamydiaceae bacterium]